MGSAVRFGRIGQPYPAYPGVMDTIALAAAAATTSTIGLYSSVLVGPAWPAVLLAKEAASIDAVSGGRSPWVSGSGTVRTTTLWRVWRRNRWTGDLDEVKQLAQYLN